MNKKSFSNPWFVASVLILFAIGVYFVVTLLVRSSPFVGKWDVVSVEENGVPIVSEGNGATIEFFWYGNYKASGGCNAMEVSSYKIGPDSKLTMSAGGTKKKCYGNIVESHDLNKVHSYAFSGPILILRYRNDDGAESAFKLRKSGSN